METQTRTSFVKLDRAAAHLGVPAKWLKSEAMARRIPHLVAGRRILFHLPTVRRALLDRSGNSKGDDNVQ